MSGHGHVTPNPGGLKARCGGPALCSKCAAEVAALTRSEFDAVVRAESAEMARVLREAFQGLPRRLRGHL